ncbi:MAG: ribosome maturation factor RimM [Gammaproteobacteria bacterium]
MSEVAQDWVVVARIEGAYGVKGWVRVRSFTTPADNLEKYAPWRLRLPRGDRELARHEMRAHGKGYVARLEGIGDRDAAAALAGTAIMVPRAILEKPAEGQYFWSDLVGLTVRTSAGELLGQVDKMMETGANDVMVVTGDRRRLIPFVHGTVVQSVDLETGFIQVDWEPDY